MQKACCRSSSTGTTPLGGACCRPESSHPVPRSFEMPVNKPKYAVIKKNASEMSTVVENEGSEDWHLVEEDCKTEGDWELVCEDQLENLEAPALLGQKSSIAPFEGLVGGLAFNTQDPNMLAASSKADKLNVYNIEYPFTGYTSDSEIADVSEKAKNAQVTFLEWHPKYEAMLLSTTDAGITTMWDMRSQKPALRFEDKNQHCTEVHWSPNNSLHFAVSSFGQSSETVKIWDAGNVKSNYLKMQCPLFEFGPKKGVTSFSWSATHDLILTTDVGGRIKCWSSDGKQHVDLSDDVSDVLEARWCEAGHELAISTTTGGVKLCELLRAPLSSI